MGVEVKDIIFEIENISDFGLKMFYEYVLKYGKSFMYRVFNEILCNATDKESTFNKYFDIYLDIELEKMIIDDTTYLKLSNKYGEDRVVNYFNILLVVSDNQNLVKKKYEKIYFYIDTVEILESEENLDFEIVDCEDLVRCYLKDISRYPLLKPEDERLLMEQLVRSRKTVDIVYFDDLDNFIFYDVLSVVKSIRTKEQFKKLKKIVDKMCDSDKEKIQNYMFEMKNKFKVDDVLILDEEPIFDSDYLDIQFNKIVNFINAKERLINSNLRLVVSVAKRYANKGVHILDLISEGNIGLLRAVRRFDITRKTRLSTYATWWIRQSITRYITDNSRVVRIPVHFDEKMRRYSNFVKSVLQETGEDVSDELVADVLGFTLEEIEDIKNVMNSVSFVSLDSLINDEADASFLEMIADDNTTEDEYFKREHNEQLLECLDFLKEREILVIKYRFGFYGGKEYTLEEVGEKLGVTRERIRQIEKKALAKMRSGSKARKHDGYYFRGNM